ncbi:MAG: tetratricopeptide repeat protein [Cytophagales bacterium]|nr:MAG: tetratricopeptide repeat protein [Cytophagales bacterium]
MSDLRKISSRFVLFFIFFLGFWVLKAQNNYSVDSLLQIVNDAQKSKLDRINTYNLLAERLMNQQPAQALEYAQMALEIAEKENLNTEKAKAYQHIATIFRKQGDYPKAMENFLKAQSIYEQLKDIKQLAAVYNSIGTIFQLQSKDKEALEFYQKALQNAESVKDEAELAKIYNNIGNIYFNENKNNEALNYYNQALKINQKLKKYAIAAENLSNIGSVYMFSEQLEKAINFYEQALELHRKSNNLEGEAAIMYFMSGVYLRKEEVKKAKEYAQQSLRIADSLNIKVYIRDALERLSDLYAKEADFQNAFYYFKLHSQYKDSITNEYTATNITRLQFGYELEKKQAQIDLLDKDRQFNSFLQYGMLAGLSFVAIFIFILYNNYQKQRRQSIEVMEANLMIQLKNDLLTEQKEIIERKKQDIDSSILYAKRIQDAMLPYENTIAQYIPDYFIFLRPRDVVSGDFYWFTVTEPEATYAINPDIGGKPSIFKGFSSEKYVIAAVDCTGHGIPGAFMSMIGHSLLTEIVNEQKITEPDRILNVLHLDVRKNLKQAEQQNYDGMDLAICTIDPEAKILKYAGGHNPLIYIQNGQLFEVKADKFGIGGYQTGLERIFTKHTIDISIPTTCYIFSDGYQDQFGGKEGKKFMKKRMFELFLKIHHLPMQEQKEIIEKNFNEWSGEYAQVDDVLMIGFKF